MDTLDFLRQVLPGQGMKAIAYKDGSTTNLTGQLFCSTIEQLKASLDRLAGQNYEVFVAMGGFSQNARRAQFVTHLRSLWLDLDYGSDKPNQTVQQATEALIRFIGQQQLPNPMILHTGHGFHVHWPLDADVPINEWRPMAEGLKQAAIQAQLGADYGVTADAARVLRAPGYYNLKDPDRPRQIRVLRETQPYSPASLRPKFNGVPRETHRPAPGKPQLNQAYIVEPDYPETKAEVVATQCLQLKRMKETGGKVAEPVWYACLGVLSVCENGDAIAHAWSKGHPNYTERETNAKLAQWRRSCDGPTTCNEFRSKDVTQLCTQCRQTCSTPAMLGRPVPTPAPPPQQNIPNPPFPYSRTQQGIYLKFEDKPPVKLLDHDFYPYQIVFDRNDEKQYGCWKYESPSDGTLDVRIPIQACSDNTSAANALLNNGILCKTTKEHLQLLRGYMMSYLRELQKQAKTIDLRTHFGWMSQEEFILGNHLFTKKGYRDVGLSGGISKDLAAAYEPKGDFRTWIDAVSVMAQPGMEAHAFGFLCGFAAPLMKLTGYEGLFVNMLGFTGTGKTTVQSAINSIWGDHKTLQLNQSDTEHSIFARMGVYANLPATLDEITNIDPLRLSDFVYRITTGRERKRLTSKAMERAAPNWCTILVGSSNASLSDRLAMAKADTTAESMRLFELTVPDTPLFNSGAGRALARAVMENYGHAGRAYIHWVLNNMTTVKKMIDSTDAMVSGKLRFQEYERYWRTLVTLVITSVQILQQMQMLYFDAGRIIEWCRTVVEVQKTAVEENKFTPIELIGLFLQENIRSLAVVERIKARKKGDKDEFTLLHSPNFQLVARFDQSIKMLYVSQSHMHSWLDERRANRREVMAWLQEKKILRTPIGKESLGKGLPGLPTTQVRCWTIDMARPELGVVLSSVSSWYSQPDKILGETG